MFGGPHLLILRTYSSKESWERLGQGLDTNRRYSDMCDRWPFMDNIEGYSTLRDKRKGEVDRERQNEREEKYLP